MIEWVQNPEAKSTMYINEGSFVRNRAQFRRCSLCSCKRFFHGKLLTGFEIFPNFQFQTYKGIVPSVFFICRIPFLYVNTIITGFQFKAFSSYHCRKFKHDDNDDNVNEHNIMMIINMANNYVNDFVKVKW